MEEWIYECLFELDELRYITFFASNDFPENLLSRTFSRSEVADEVFLSRLAPGSRGKDCGRVGALSRIWAT